MLIKVVRVVEVGIGPNRSSIFPRVIIYQEEVLKGEVDKDLRPATIPTITHVAMVYCWVSNFLLFVLKKVFTNMRD